MIKLDLHGRNQDEARILIESFIKESYETRQYFVCIIHGVGQNILSKLTWQILANNEYVRNYEFAPPQFGGAGATIVYLKGKDD